MMVTTMITVSTLWHNRLHPLPRVQCPVIKNLSITDSAVSPIPGPECIWFFDLPAGSPALFSSESLITSLQKTLALYPFFAGKLEEIPFRADGDWTERQGRLRVVYGQSDDPGIQVVIASCDQKLAAVIPTSTQRGRIWDSSVVPFGLFAGFEIPMALHDGVELGKMSLMRVKITTFSCGGVAIAAKIVHPIADAQNLSSFVQSWSVNHQGLNQSNLNGWHDSKVSGPILAPEIFMATASNLNTALPDPSSVEIARALPIHRYDWWASSEGCPPPLLWRTRTDPAVKDSGVELPPLGKPIPWSDLDITGPISHYNIFFSPQEIEGMHKAALRSQSLSLKQEFRLSHLDALLSHIWTLTIRARRLPNDDEIFFNMVVNFRSRVNPPLPKTYIGTPAILAYAKCSTKDAVGEASVGKLGRAIRSTIASLNPTTIPHFLHDAAHQIEPKRYWQTFIGTHHVTASSWLNHGIHDIDFGSGLGPRYVEPVMPPYLVCVIEPERSMHVKGGQSNGDAESNTSKHWYARGAIVSLHFETGVMDRLLQDPQLRAFDDTM